MTQEEGPARLAPRLDAHATGARGRRFGFPRDYAARYGAVHGGALAQDWLRGWDAEDEAIHRKEAERAARQPG